MLQEAYSINDNGQIVGKGYLTSSSGTTRYFLLTVGRSIAEAGAPPDLIHAVPGAPVRDAADTSAERELRD